MIPKRRFPECTKIILLQNHCQRWGRSCTRSKRLILETTTSVIFAASWQSWLPISCVILLWSLWKKAGGMRIPQTACVLPLILSMNISVMALRWRLLQIIWDSVYATVPVTLRRKQGWRLWSIKGKNKRAKGKRDHAFLFYTYLNAFLVITISLCQILINIRQNISRYLKIFVYNETYSKRFQKLL